MTYQTLPPSPWLPLRISTGANARTRLPQRSRHGRGPRAAVIPPHLPGFRTRAETFDSLAMEAAQSLAERLATMQLDIGPVEFIVEDVPATDPMPWEPSRISLSRVIAHQGAPPRIVLYRRPIECSVNGRRELASLLYHVMLGQVAHLAGLSPNDIDPYHQAP